MHRLGGLARRIALPVRAIPLKFRPVGLPQQRWQCTTAVETPDDAAPTVATEAPVEQAVLGPEALKAKMIKSIKHHQYEEAIRIFEALLESGAALDMASLNCVIEAKSHLSNNVDESMNMLEVLLAAPANKDLTPDAATYCSLMKACLSPPNAKQAKILYDQMLEKDIAPSLEVYNQLVMIYTRAENFDGAEALFSEMRNNKVAPKRQTYLRFISGCFYGKEPERAFKMLCTMESEWRLPEAVDYERMMRWFAREKHFEGQLKCFDALAQALKDGTLPTEIKMDGLVPSLLKDSQDNNHPQQFINVFKMAQKHGIYLGKFQQVGLLFAYLQTNNAKGAFEQLVETLVAGHNKLAPRIRETIAEKLAEQASTVDDAYYVLESRKEAGQVVPLLAINIVIEACAHMEDLDRAFATFSEVEGFGLKPDTSTYNALLHTCVKAKEYASARRLLAQMETEEIPRDAMTYYYQCRLASTTREDTVALQLLQQCKDDGHAPVGRMYSMIISMLCYKGKGDKAKELMKEMEEADHFITRTFRERVEQAVNDPNSAPRPYRRGGHSGAAWGNQRRRPDE